MRTLWEAFSAIAAAVGALATFGAVLVGANPSMDGFLEKKNIRENTQGLAVFEAGAIASKYLKNHR